MNFNNILIAGINKSDLEPKIWQRIEKLSRSKLLCLSDVDCMLVKFNPVDSQFMGMFPSLKYVGVLATGYGKIDLEYAKKNKITVCNIPGYCTESVAEFTFSVILDYLRELEKGKKQVSEGNYSESGFKAAEIKNKKFAILGLGRIGGRVAEIAKAFGADVFYFSRTRKKEFEKKGIKYEDADKLISQSDFLSLHLSLTTETQNFLNKKRIAKIKKGAVVVNLSPMELVDIDALEKRLKKNDITFILDHSDEMNGKDLRRLSKYKNCIIYPPIAYISDEAKVAKQEIFVRNIESYLKGTPINKVN